MPPQPERQREREPRSDPRTHAEVHRLARALFDATLDQPASERAEYIGNACGGNADLRALVETLLRNHVEEQQRPADGRILRPLLLSTHRSDLACRRMGRYLLEQRIGEGGMGQVYRAAQESPKRLVALKLLRGVLASAEGLRRFRYEIELLGALDHPGIARIYEAGVETVDGESVPFFAMEYIEDARSILEFAAERGLGIDERVELVARVCDAVHHGHQRGIVHRDLKPANILVDRSGAPKIIDFGVAISTNSDVALTTMHTQVGELLGTLQYMSPEQCDADPAAIDIRTDVYSLGLVLYELLCGRRPYDVPTTSLLAAARTIREQPPTSPSAVQRGLRGDLEAIVLEALQKDRAKRYGSAEALGADLQRFLRGEPVSVRAPSAWSRGWTWVARHPALGTAAACTAIIAISVVAFLLGQWFFARQPARLEISDDRSAVVLKSRAGKIVSGWDLVGKDAVAAAFLVEPEDAPAGRRVVVIGATSAGKWRFGSHVCVFALDRPQEPLWSTAYIPLVEPPGRPVRPEEKFILELVLLEDIFPERRGLEIVTTQRSSPYSACAISVLDLTGELLYRAWNEGPMTALRWMPGVRRLVAASAECDRSFHAVAPEAPEPHPTYPGVVFALEPVLGRKDWSDWMVRNGALRDETLRWYWWVGPLSALVGIGDDTSCGLNGEVGSFDSATHCTFVYQAGIRSSGFSGAALNFVLDEDGRIQSRYATDDWKNAHLGGKLPAPEPLTLLPYSALPR